MTSDWVVVFYDDGRGERQATVVPETRGPLATLRVVRGREDECLDYHRMRERAGALERAS